MINTKEQYKQQKKSENLLLGYKGEITDNLTSSLLSLAESKLAMVEYNSRLKKKVFHILVEVLQNIYHNYNDMLKAPDNYQEVFLMIVREDKSYNIVAGNYMQQAHIQKLKQRIDQVNAMDPESLRAKYRIKLDEGEFTEIGRAGLGIMDMVRKSGQPLEYDFLSVDKEYSFFSLKINIQYK
ncbi:hypothetical protein JKA74_04315 [Marivirga sp. S37H4]|uniref:Uncharacterized protein n=1 Tax=Marivirga aurantiaca TaxID=2802615 RepID=A0A935C697_9BACT|nr:SiaB family protein kinase [Marivirga aurantiaca]MBK6264250.1 hypothetical protein [Marivirga aurantiaca]